MLSTTELLVEHIISGILSCIWILAIIVSFTGLDPSVLPFVKEFWGLFAVVGTAIAYPIGIFLDTFADKILSRRNEKIKLKYGLEDDFSLLVLINAMKDDNIRSYFTYNRFKTRVSRSSFLNFMMIAIAAPIFILSRGLDIGISNSGKMSFVFFVVFGLLSGTAFYLWNEIVRATFKRAGELWRIRSELAKSL